MAEKPKIKNTSKNTSRLLARKDTIFRHGRDLSILCGVDVCILYAPPDGGKVEAWPPVNLEDEEVRAFIRQAAAASGCDGNPSRKRRRANQSQIPDENQKRKKLLISSPEGQTCDGTNNVSEGDYFDFSPETWYGDITDIGSPDIDTNNNINIVSGEAPGGKGHFLYPSQSHPDMYLCDSSNYGMNEAEFENQYNQEWSNAEFPFSEGMVNNGVLNNHDPWVQQLL